MSINATTPENAACNTSHAHSRTAHSYKRRLFSHWRQCEAFLSRCVSHLVDEVGDPVLRVADKDGGGERHAALAGSAKGGARELVERRLLVRVREDRAVVLGSHVGLHALARLRDGEERKQEREKHPK